MKKKGELIVPVIILTILILIISISLAILIWKSEYKEQSEEDIDQLKNITRIQQIDNAIQHNLSLTNNPPTCRDECSALGLRRCSGEGYKVCGNFNSDSCYEWSPSISCGDNSTCSSGRCISIPIEEQPEIELPVQTNNAVTRYDFDEIEILSVEQFNITKEPSSTSNTWADQLIGNSENLQVTYSVINLKKNDQPLVKEEEFIKVSGVNGEKRFLLNALSNKYYNSYDKSTLESRTSFFWSAKQLIGEDIVKDKTLPIYSVSLLRSFDKNGTETSPKLSFSDDGLNNSYENRLYDWDKVRNTFVIGNDTNNSENSSNIDCELWGDLNFFLSNSISLPKGNLEIHIKSSDENPAPEVYIPIYNEEGNILMNVKLFNDGLHEDVNSNDYISQGYFKAPQEEGTYRVSFCNKSETFEVVDLEILPLYPEHNIRNADRINIILFSSGYDSIEQFKEVAKKVLSFDGEFTRYNYTINYLEYDISPGNLIANSSSDYEVKTIGFFATEPFKSNKDKFNIWYVNKQMTGSLRQIFIKLGGGIKEIGLNYSSFALFANDKFDEKDAGLGDVYRSSAMIAQLPPSNSLVKGDIKFGITLNSFPISKNYNYTKGNRMLIYNYEGLNLRNPYSLLTHEIGHALFGLKDEYSEPGSIDIFYGYPNCALNMTEAEAKWGDKVGQVDSFYYAAADFLNNGVSSEFEQIKEDDLRTGYIYGGCFGPANSLEVIRPTLKSIMNDYTVPIFGSVNRARIEEILNLFSGN